MTRLVINQRRAEHGSHLQAIHDNIKGVRRPVDLIGGCRLTRRQHAPMATVYSQTARIDEAVVFGLAADVE